MSKTAPFFSKTEPADDRVTEPVPDVAGSPVDAISETDYMSPDESELQAVGGIPGPPSPRSAARERYGVFVEVGVISPTLREDPPLTREDPPPHAWNADLLKDIWGQMTRELLGKPITTIEILSPRTAIIFCGLRSRKEGMTCEESEVLAHHMCRLDSFCGKRVWAQAYQLTLNHASVRIAEVRSEQRAAKARQSRQKREAAIQAHPDMAAVVRELVDALQRAVERPSRSRRPSPGVNSRTGAAATRATLMDPVNVDLHQADTVTVRDAMETPLMGAPCTSGDDPLPPYPIDPAPRLVTSATNTEERGDEGSYDSGRDRRAPRDKLKLPIFRDERTATATTYANWRWQVKKAFACGYDERAVLRAVIASLEGGPSETLRTSGTNATLADILSKLDRYYDNSQTYAELHAKIMSIRQGDREPVNEYAVRLDVAVDAVRTAFPDATSEESLLSLHRERFFDGLHLEYQNHLIHKRDSPMSLLELVKEARILEEKGAVRKALSYDRNKYQPNRGHPNVRKAEVESEVTDQGYYSDYDSLPVYVRDVIEREEHRTGACWDCGTPGHYFRECPKRKRDQLNRRGAPERKAPWGPPKTKPLSAPAETTPATAVRASEPTPALEPTSAPDNPE